MNPETSNTEASAHRDRSIRLAVITSLVSKIGTIVLRLVSIPIAIRLLGMDQFGVYAAITMAVGLIDMLHVGIGPALTREISKALARGDRERERAVFATSILLSTGLTLLALFGAACLLYHIPIPTLFGEEFAPLSEVMYRAAWLGLAIISIEMICVTFEMGRDGYQETRFTNAWGAAGNVLGAVALIVGIRYFPTIEFLLIAVNGSIALAKLGNTCHLLIQRKYLLPRVSLFQRQLVPPLVKDSLRFSVTYILAAAVEYNLMAFCIGRVAGPEAVGVFNIMITVHFSLTGLVAMITRPFWPALMDAYERKDSLWCRAATRKLRLGGMGFAFLAGAGMTLVGPWALPLWAGEELTSVSSNFQMEHLALFAFSLYFSLHVWRHINQTICLGVGRINSVVMIVICEAVFLFSLTDYALVHFGSIAPIYLAMAGAILLFTSWMFPLLFAQTFRNLEQEPEESQGSSPPLVDASRLMP